MKWHQQWPNKDRENSRSLSNVRFKRMIMMPSCFVVILSLLPIAFVANCHFFSCFFLIIPIQTCHQKRMNLQMNVLWVNSTSLASSLEWHWFLALICSLGQEVPKQSHKWKQETKKLDQVIIIINTFVMSWILKLTILQKLFLHVVVSMILVCHFVLPFVSINLKTSLNFALVIHESRI